MVVILLLAVVVLYVWVLRLADRVNQLESMAARPQVTDAQTNQPTIPESYGKNKPPAFDIHELSVPVPTVVQATAMSTPARMPLPQFSPLTVVPAPTPMSTQTSADTVPNEFIIYTWFKEQTLIKIGALIFFLGAVWFVSYAISQGWIPVFVRILLGLLVALIIYALGVWRKSQNEGQYIVLTVLGTGIVLVTVYCAQFLFGLFVAPVALVIMVASIAYTVYVSIETKTEWLATMSALAGFVAPFLIGVTNPDMTLLMFYLFVLAASFAVVTFFTQWRVVPLVLVVGVSYFQLWALSIPLFPLLWFSMILFAGLFLAMTTVRLSRSQAPQPADIFALAVSGSMYTYGAHTLAYSSSLALFVAAFLLAGVGYVLSGNQVSKRVVSVYVCFASVAWVIGTCFLLTGFSLLFALTIEVLGAFLILTDLRLSARAVYISMWAFVLPIGASIPVIFSDRWSEGIWHLDALATVTVALVLTFATLWVRERPLLLAESWAGAVSATLGLTGFVYTIVLLAQIARATSVSSEVYMYVLWGAFIFGCLYYAIIRKLPQMWITVAFSALSLPLVVSITSFNALGWLDSALHPAAVGVYATWALLLCTMLTLKVWYSESRLASARQILLTSSIVLLGYSLAVIALVWYALTPDPIANVLTYVTYGLVVYLAALWWWQQNQPLPWVQYVTSVGILPVLLSTASLDSSGWGTSVVHPQAAGLYVMTVLISLMALRYLTYRGDDNNPEETTRAQNWGRGLCILAGIYGVSIVWLVTHTLSATSDIAVTIALFVYTVAGLGLYVLGSSHGRPFIKYAGMSLLILVIVRLGLFEIWSMVILWKIVTFLGIGLLFMVAALLEKKN